MSPLWVKACECQEWGSTGSTSIRKIWSDGLGTPHRWLTFLVGILNLFIGLASARNRHRTRLRRQVTQPASKRLLCAFTNRHHFSPRTHIWIEHSKSDNPSSEGKALERPSNIAMSAPNGTDAEKNIEIWKVKKLIKRLEAARGNGTSMISLIIRELSDCCLCSSNADGVCV